MRVKLHDVYLLSRTWLPFVHGPYSLSSHFHFTVTYLHEPVDEAAKKKRENKIKHASAYMFTQQIETRVCRSGDCKSDSHLNWSMMLPTGAMCCIR